jgi:acyl-CoA thioesterase FadM
MYMKSCVTVLQVRPNDLDSFGHVNNATALEYLETGRWDWIVQNGLCLKRQPTAVVARIEINYLKIIDTKYVEIRTALEKELDPAELNYKVVFLQSIYINHHAEPADRTLAINACVEVGFLDVGKQQRTTAQHFLNCAVA